ncbi:uncharacterized protein LOC17883565 [Capsella rubella]|uniref:uncharacterized protein LOC17883565 n=1 Tax=Capsella rubella TaxID=81985 RepID=UPI000CD591AA|nr:uncharacterized protein LOC17883565 [Capsella rubella]
MVAHWDTDGAQQRSLTYFKARMSDCDGLGPHIYLSGPKSYQQIQTEMEDKIGRIVSLGEVFIKTHTKSEGMYVDWKAEIIAHNCEKNLQAKLDELEVDSSAVSDGASQPWELTADEYTAIFLQSTEKDSQGNYYGVGSLKDNLGVLGKRKRPYQSFMALQEQLEEAQHKIEEQTTLNSQAAAREVDISLVVSQQKDNINKLEKFLRHSNPAFVDFLVTESAEATTTDPLTTNLPATAPQSTPPSTS